jgi:hypothetical protein
MNAAGARRNGAKPRKESKTMHYRASFSPQTRAFSGLVALLLSGCGAGSGEPGPMLGEAEGRLGVSMVGQKGTNLETARGLVSVNSLKPGVLGDVAFISDLKQLVQGAVADAAFDLSPTALLSTDDGRALLKYAIRCALAAGTTVTASGTPWTFEGGLGLAPGWLTAALTPSEGRWLTACLMAHANAYNIPTVVLLGGAHPALQQTGSYAHVYPEASFYGDLFDGSPATIYACARAGIAVRDGSGVCVTPDLDALRRRVCGRSSQCSFQVAGYCYAAANPANDVCAGTPGAPAACYPGAAAQGGTPYREVITVYLPGTPGPCNGIAGCGGDGGCALGAPRLDGCGDTYTVPVCAADPYCCSVSWDALCADAAKELGQSCPACAHPTVDEGAPLWPGCSTCVDEVSAALPHCSETAWDASCVTEAQEAGCP